MLVSLAAKLRQPESRAVQRLGHLEAWLDYTINAATADGLCDAGVCDFGFML